MAQKERIESVTRVQIEVLTNYGKRSIIYEGIDSPKLSISNDFANSNDFAKANMVAKLKFNYKNFYVE